MKSRSVIGSIDCEAHQREVVSRRKKKLPEKMRGFSNLYRKMTRNSNTAEDMLYSFKNTETVREQLQQFHNIFRMMLDVQNS